MSRVIVEFYGIPRQRAGLVELTVSAGTVADALAAVKCHCPELHDLCGDRGLAPQYRLSLDGQRFVTELDEKLPAGARLLLLSADAGG